MKIYRLIIPVILFISGSVLLSAGNIEHSDNAPAYTYHYIKSFSKATNQKIKKFLDNTINTKDKKIAVFDCDGTLIGQVPHYIADEAIFLYAKKHPKWKPEVLKTMKKTNINDSHYNLTRIHYLAGLKVNEVEDMGYDFYKEHYNNKYFSPMLQLVKNLQNYNFEIWVVTGSPEILYQKILSTVFNIPKNHIIGVKTLTKDGKITETLVPPATENEGKVTAIDTFIKAKPLFAAGNSSADFEMINDSKGLKLVVNPDDKKTQKLFDGNTLKGYAEKHDWIIVHIKDQTPENYPNVSTKIFHIPENPSVN